MWDYQNCLLRNPYIPDKVKLNNGSSISITKLKLDYKNMIIKYNVGLINSERTENNM